MRNQHRLYVSIQNDEIRSIDLSHFDRLSKGHTVLQFQIGTFIESGKNNFYSINRLIMRNSIKYVDCT